MQIPTEQIKGIQRTGRAEVVRDVKSGGVKWHTFGPNDDIGHNMEINESLVLPPTAFQVGTFVEIFEDIQ